jgi:hypothetical protein
MAKCQAFHEFNPQILNEHERNNFTKFISDIIEAVASAAHRRHPVLPLCIASLTNDVRERRWKSPAISTHIPELGNVPTISFPLI